MSTVSALFQFAVEGGTYFLLTFLCYKNNDDDDEDNDDDKSDFINVSRKIAEENPSAKISKILAKIQMGQFKIAHFGKE